MSSQQVIQEIKAATNIYIAIANAERELGTLKKAHKNTPFSAHQLQQHVASIGRTFEQALEMHSNHVINGSEQERLLHAMINSIHSFQRYAISKIPPDKATAESSAIYAI